MASTSSTEHPISSNGIDDTIQQVYVLDPIAKPEITGQKSKIKQDYMQQGQQQQTTRYKSLPKNTQSIKTSTKIR